ncbi:MAG: hypothetical protein AABY22_04825 [Nanoarchaeota archaeon]
MSLKTHIFIIKMGRAGSLCGYFDRDGIAYNYEKKATCLRCKKSYKIILKNSKVKTR